MSIKKRGFASLTPERRVELGRKGGTTTKARKTAHKWTPKTAKAAAKLSLQSRRANNHRRKQGE